MEDLSFWALVSEFLCCVGNNLLGRWQAKTDKNPVTLNWMASVFLEAKTCTHRESMMGQTLGECVVPNNLIGNILV